MGLRSLRSLSSGCGSTTIYQVFQASISDCWPHEDFQISRLRQVRSTLLRLSCQDWQVPAYGGHFKILFGKVETDSTVGVWEWLCVSVREPFIIICNKLDPPFDWINSIQFYNTTIKII